MLSGISPALNGAEVARKLYLTFLSSTIVDLALPDLGDTFGESCPPGLARGDVVGLDTLGETGVAAASLTSSCFSGMILSEGDFTSGKTSVNSMDAPSQKNESFAVLSVPSKNGKSCTCREILPTKGSVLTGDGGVEDFDTARTGCGRDCCLGDVGFLVTGSSTRLCSGGRPDGATRPGFSPRVRVRGDKSVRARNGDRDAEREGRTVAAGTGFGEMAAGLESLSALAMFSGGGGVSGRSSGSLVAATFGGGVRATGRGRREGGVGC